MDEKLLEIIRHYGIEHQQRKLEEEVFELQEAITLYESCIYGGCLDKLKEHIAEELADVMVMLRQFQLYYEIKDEDIKKIMQEKIDRQIERIKKEK